MRQEIRSGPLINADESSFQVMKEPNRKNTSKSYIWVFRGGPVENPVVMFHCEPSRSGQVPHDFLDGYQGYVQTDGYQGYNILSVLTWVLFGLLLTPIYFISEFPEIAQPLSCKVV